MDFVLLCCATAASGTCLALSHAWRKRCMEATRITVDEVKQRLDRGEEFVFLDTRNPQAWAESDKKLPHAFRLPAAELNEQLEARPKDRAVTTYCTAPHEGTR